MTFPRKIFFFAASLLFAVPALAVDEVDNAAIEDLRALVAAECKTHPECPLDDLFSRLQQPVVAGMSVLMDNDTGYFPEAPPEGVTSDEWRASQNFSIDKEDPPITLSLLDLDGDGQRDLIISSGWDSEFVSFVSTWALRRKGDTFDAITPFHGDVWHALFTTGDTGSTAYWIRLRGRIYAVKCWNEHGSDSIYLRRPFVSNGEMPMLVVRYHYQLSVPIEEIKKEGDQLDELKKETALNDKKLSEALTAALQSMGDKVPDLTVPKTPFCPIPASVKGDDRKRYYTYHSAEEVDELSTGDFNTSSPEEDAVGDLSVQLGNKCYIGRLYDNNGIYFASGFGAGGSVVPRLYGNDGIYLGNGLVDAMLVIHTPGKKDGGDYFKVNGIRKAVSVEISTQKGCGENGCD